MSAPKKRVDAKAVASGDRLRDLFVENATLQQLRNDNDLLERLIMAGDGIDLRAVTAKLAAHVLHEADEFNALHDRMNAIDRTSQFMQQKLPADDMTALKHLFAGVLDNNPNDDKARVTQLAIVFMALTTEIDARQQLTAQPRHSERFAGAAAPPPPTPSPDTAERAQRALAEKQERAQRARANQIQNAPLVMFLKNDARRLLTQLVEGMLDLRAYVTECVTAYMSYKPTVCPYASAKYRNIALPTQ